MCQLRAGWHVIHRYYGDRQAATVLRTEYSIHSSYCCWWLLLLRCCSNRAQLVRVHTHTHTRTHTLSRGRGGKEPGWDHHHHMALRRIWIRFQLVNICQPTMSRLIIIVDFCSRFFYFSCHPSSLRSEDVDVTFCTPPRGPRPSPSRSSRHPGEPGPLRAHAFVPFPRDGRLGHSRVQLIDHGDLRVEKEISLRRRHLGCF